MWKCYMYTWKLFLSFYDARKDALFLLTIPGMHKWIMQWKQKRAHVDKTADKYWEKKHSECQRTKVYRWQKEEP